MASCNQPTVRMSRVILRLTDFEIKTIFRFLNASFRDHIWKENLMIKKWLNMEPKTGKENRSCDDITLSPEIITNYRYPARCIVRWASVKLRENI